MSSTNPVKNGSRDKFLVDGTQAGRDTRTPSLVSFVGQTGAGKSTLIKLIIDLAPDGSEFFTTPVIGATGAHVPTSEDVHLYLDPRTADGSSPLLFADCEGLEGGEREPVGALFKKKRRNDKKTGRFNGWSHLQSHEDHLRERIDLGGKPKHADSRVRCHKSLPATSVHVLRCHRVCSQKSSVCA
jgi:energy-coupling factor transporter ATP-binding protein EcfA2